MNFSAKKVARERPYKIAGLYVHARSRNYTRENATELVTSCNRELKTDFAAIIERCEVLIEKHGLDLEVLEAATRKEFEVKEPTDGSH